jgi:glycosyltransferase involved in cell wall biosynthesis
LAAERLALERAPIVICNSRRTRDEVVERFGISGSRVHAVYYGTDPLAFSAVAAARRADAKEALGMSRDRPLVGFVGALGDRRKAFDTVFRAWQRLCRGSSWDADLLVVGSGAEQPAWRQRAEETGLMARIRFVGYRYDVPDILAAVDALVHPARYEAYGLSVQEALCRGVPALVSARSGVAERYPSELKDLLILDPNDAGEVAERLTLWRAQIESFPPLVVPFSNHLRSRTWEAMAAEIASLVEDAAPA